MTPSISTHVLDTGRGEPARGVRVELYRQTQRLSVQETNHDGRIPDLVRGPLEAGPYRLIVHLPTPFFSRLELEFTIADAARSYHIPLLVSPYACTVYRGG